MISLPLCLIVFFTIFTSLVSFLNENESSLILNLIKGIGIRHCIIVHNKIRINIVKKFSARGLSATVFTYSQLLDFIQNGSNYLDAHAIILKEKNFSNIESILEDFIWANRTSDMKNFTWLALLDDETVRQQETDLILYDCEFIYPVNSRVYELKEIYMVKKKLFSYDFGIWRESEGLKTTNVSLYRRRLNLNRTEIRFISHDGLLGPEASEMFQAFLAMTNMSFVKLDAILDEGKFLPDDIKVVAIPLSPRIEGLFPHTVGPIYKLTVNWYIKYPRAEKRSDYYIQPFEIHLWLVIATSIVIGSISVTVIHRFNPNILLIDHVLIGLDCYCNQSGCNPVNTSSLQIVCATLRLSALIVVSSYLAVNVSFLTTEIPDIPFRNWEEYLQNGKYQLLVADVYALVHAEVFLYGNPAMCKTMIAYEKGVNDFATFCRKNLAIPFLNNDAYSFTDEFGQKLNQCEIFKIERPLTVANAFFNFDSLGEFKKVFQHHLIRFYECGIQNRMKQMINKHQLKEIIRQHEAVFSVEMKQTIQIMLIPFAGVGLAGILIVLERWNHFHKKINLEGIKII